MFIVHATFEISSGRISRAGVTPFSHCPNPADVERAFDDYAREIGYTDHVGPMVWAGFAWNEGIMALSSHTESAEANAKAEAIYSAARAVYSAQQLTGAELAARRLAEQPARI